MGARIPAVMCITCGVEMLCEEKAKLVEVIVTSWGSYYKIYAGIYMCPTCSTEVALPAEAPIVFQHEKHYNNYRADYEVNIN